MSQLKFFTKTNYGRADMYLMDENVSQVLNQITGKPLTKEGYYPLSAKEMEALRHINYTFINVLPPKK